MELAEPIERINQTLADLYGIDVVTGLPIWRVVWANDQREKRVTEWSDDGSIYLLHPEVRELPKYPQAKDRYILEKLVILNEQAQKELAGQKINYEPMWAFMDKYGNYLPPKLDFIFIVIDSVNAALGKGNLAKYLEDPDTPENKEKRLKEYEKYISADETDVSDALRVKEGVVIPSKFFGD